MLKQLLVRITLSACLTALLVYFKTGQNQEGLSNALFIISAVYIVIGGLSVSVLTQRKIFDDLGRKQGMSEEELKHVYRNVPATQNGGVGWFDAFGGNKQYISKGRLSAVISLIIGLTSLVIAIGLSGYFI